jgi:hypothetical protein
MPKSTCLPMCWPSLLTQWRSEQRRTQGGFEGVRSNPPFDCPYVYIVTYLPSVASRTRPLCLPGSDCAHKMLVLGLGHAPSIQNGRGLIKRGVVYKNSRALRAHRSNVTPLSEILRTPLQNINVLKWLTDSDHSCT